MNDELGRHLRDEIPRPRAGYWEGIDASLADVAGDSSDTTASVVRPMGMNERRNDLSTRFLAVAAAIAVLAAAGIFLTTRDDGSTDTDIAADTTVDGEQATTLDDESVTTVGDTATTESTTTVPPESTESVTTVEAVGFPPLADGVERRCYLDFVAGESPLVVEFGADGIIRSASMRRGELSELAWGSAFGADGSHVMVVETRIDGSGDRYGAAWFISDEVVSQAEDVAFEAAECSEANAEMVAAANNVALATPLPDEPAVVPGQRCFENRDGRVWTEFVRIDVDADGSVRFLGRTDTDDETILETGSGSFITEADVALDITRVDAADARRTEVYTLVDGGMTFGLGFFNEAVDCAEIATQFDVFDVTS